MNVSLSASSYLAVRAMLARLREHRTWEFRGKFGLNFSQLG